MCIVYPMIIYVGRNILLYIYVVSTLKWLVFRENRMFNKINAENKAKSFYA